MITYDHWWLSMWREDGAVEGGRFEGNAGDSFGSCVARSEKRRCIWRIGNVRTVFGPVKEMLSESVERCGGWERENWDLHWHWSRFSTRKAGRKNGKRKGSRHSRW